MGRPSVGLADRVLPRLGSWRLTNKKAVHWPTADASKHFLPCVVPYGNMGDAKSPLMQYFAGANKMCIKPLPKQTARWFERDLTSIRISRSAGKRGSTAYFLKSMGNGENFLTITWGGRTGDAEGEGWGREQRAIGDKK